MQETSLCRDLTLDNIVLSRELASIFHYSYLLTPFMIFINEVIYTTCYEERIKYQHRSLLQFFDTREYVLCAKNDVLLIACLMGGCKMWDFGLMISLLYRGMQI